LGQIAKENSSGIPLQTRYELRLELNLNNGNDATSDHLPLLVIVAVLEDHHEYTAELDKNADDG